MATEYDGRYSDTLTMHAVATTMASSLCAGSAFDTFEMLGTTEKTLAMDAYNPVLPPSKTSFYIVVRNKRTNEQLMHPKEFDSLNDWFVQFREYPIFAVIDHEQQLAVPKLKQPTYGGNAWEHNVFRYTAKNGVTTEWDVIVTLGIKDDARRAPNAERDIVDMCVISPPLPNGAEAYDAVCATSFDKYEAVVRMACIEHANLLLNFERSDDIDSTVHATKTPRTDPARRAVIIDGTNTPSNNELHTSLYASFKSFKRETSAGSLIIPLMLKHASFVLPCIQAGDCKYTILRPHNFGYIVRIEDVAGWQILASVNMTISSAAIQRMLHTHRTYTALGRRSQASTLDLNQAMREESPEGINRRAATMGQLSIAIQSKVDDLASTLSASIRASLKDLSAFDATDTTSNSEALAELKRNRDLWMRHMAFVGSSMLETKLAQLNGAATMVEDKRRGDAFIALYQKNDSSSEDIALVARTLFDICLGIATVLLEKNYIKQARGAMSVKPEEKFSTQFLGHTVKHQDENTMDAQKIIKFMQRNCKGITPDKWVVLAHTSFIKNPMNMACALLNNPAAFAPLLPNPAMSHGLYTYISQSIFVFDPDMATIRETHNQDYAIRGKMEDSILSLAYFIYSTAAGGGIHYSTIGAAMGAHSNEILRYSVELSDISTKTENLNKKFEKEKADLDHSTQLKATKFLKDLEHNSVSFKTQLDEYTDDIKQYKLDFDGDIDTLKRKHLREQWETASSQHSKKIESALTSIKTLQGKINNLLLEHVKFDNAIYKKTATSFIASGNAKMDVNKEKINAQRAIIDAKNEILNTNRKLLKDINQELITATSKWKDANKVHEASKATEEIKASKSKLDRYYNDKKIVEKKLQSMNDMVDKVHDDITICKNLISRIDDANKEIQRRIDINNRIILGEYDLIPLKCVSTGEYGDDDMGAASCGTAGGLSAIKQSAAYVLAHHERQIASLQLKIKHLTDDAVFLKGDEKTKNEEDLLKAQTKLTAEQLLVDEAKRFQEATEKMQDATKKLHGDEDEEIDMGA